MWRDASGRLTFDLDVSETEYASLCRQISEAFSLAPEGNLLAGPDQMFWEYRRGEAVVELDWYFWMRFMVVAHTPDAESLVIDIAEWLGDRSPE